MSASPYYTDEHVTLYHGDCREVMPQIEGVTAIVSDPPYGLSFMGKGWDHGVPGEDFWRIASGCCLPGAPMLAFGGTRTYHRLVCAIEDAGWEVRDCLQWLYASGFPKSHNVGKALDKAAGNGRNDSPMTRKDTGFRMQAGGTPALPPATPAARTWEGWGTALKPAHEPICLAMNPLDGTYAQNALEHGVAGLNVDGGRVAASGVPVFSTDGGRKFEQTHTQPERRTKQVGTSDQGRWPANILHDGSEEVLAGFPSAGGGKFSRNSDSGRTAISTRAHNPRPPNTTGSVCNYGDSGTAARFFYCAKASKAERNRGCEGLPEKVRSGMNTHGGDADKGEAWMPIDERTGKPRDRFKSVQSNNHPTVKPLALMRYLCTLVTMPERNLILDPFAGSGTTGVACKELGLPCVLIEQDEHHCEIIAARIAAAKQDAPPPPSPQKEFAL